MCCQRNPFYSTMLLYTYISRFSVTPTISNPAELPPPTLFPNRSSLRFQLLSQMAHVCFHRRKWVHTRLSEKDRTQGHTRRNRGRFERGGITTLDTYCTFTNIPGPGIRTAYFAAFGSWPGVLPKNAESLRNSDALMRVAVPRRRGPAGLRDLFRFCRNRDLYIRRSWFSACARQGRYHYPRSALRAAETLDGRLSKGLICRFLRLPSSTPCAVTFSANTQISLSAISVANTFALWYDKSQIRIFRR